MTRSALKPLIILKPVKVSSINDKKFPVSFCAFAEFAFNFLLIDEIMNPETGNKIKTKRVSSTLIYNIIEIDISTVSGSRTSASIDVKIEFSTSCTSEVMRAIISPFFFSEK